MSHDVFISYSSDDYNVVEWIVEQLKNNGIRVWFDKKEVIGGDKFSEKITKAIKDSTVVVFFSSKASNNVSKWVCNEIAIAHQYDKVIIPVRLDDCEYHNSIAIHIPKDRVSFIDFFDIAKREENLTSLIDAVNSHLSNYTEGLDDGGEEDGNTEGLDNGGEEDGNKKGRQVLIIAAIVVVAIVVVSLLHNHKSGPVESPRELSLDSIVFNVNNVAFVLRYVECGTFQMGATKEQEDEALDNEKPSRSVTVGAFYIGETEVTQSLWKSVMGSEPTTNGGWSSQYGRGDDYPAYMLSWNDCQQFIEKLNSLTQKQFRLPTEAEWEFAARGGNRSKHFKYAGDSIVDRVAWFKENSLGKSHPVKSVHPNELGLYDMSGNVWEWCEDEYRYGDCRDYDCFRVLRGGSWEHNKNGCRVSARSTDVFDNPRTKSGLYYGFRLVLPK